MKKIPILLLFVTTLLIGFNSCETEPLEGDFEIADTTGGDDTTDDGGGDTDGSGSTSYEYMNAIIDGTEYNNMKPFGFSLGSDLSVTVLTFDFGGPKYLRVQGGFYLNVGVIGEPGEREINLFIFEDNWAEGTYVLDDDDTNDAGEGVSFMNLIYFDETGNFTDELEGSITITKFDLVNRVIEGTFDYTFNRTDSFGVLVDGPLSITGDFEYPLDDAFFD